MLPESEVGSGFDHFGQAIWHHIARLGVRQKYIEDLDLALKVSAVIALAFLSNDRIAGVLYNAERVLRYIGVFCKDLHS